MIFISYSWKDASAAEYVAAVLTEQGQRIWIDYQNLNLALPIEPQLCRAINSADTFLLLDSVNSRASRWVRFEYSFVGLLSRAVRVVHLPIGSFRDKSSLLMETALKSIGSIDGFACKRTPGDIAGSYLLGHVNM